MEFTILTMKYDSNVYYQVTVWNVCYQPRKRVIHKDFNTKKEVFQFIATYIGK